MDDGNKSCHFDVKVNLHAGELGYFQIEQCGDEVNPTVGIEKGVTYYFSQKVSILLCVPPCRWYQINLST